MNKNLLISLIIIISASVLFLIYGYPKKYTVVCTQEALICPDGSTVSRSGPNCEFAPCLNKNLKQTITPPSPSTKKYLCPKTEWIDCMPGRDKLKEECAPQYLQWAQENCPGFKGVAY